ncbi:hypothetical protein [Burkholderia sp. BCC1999]|uniref:hypothetical protein n=1 Tax=Burkholderia sp. BCC1999 TaxID=2817448 RepID=UPI002AC33DDF|nr:hypothetical protein [Burkholderia sp. BCC1999]
MKAIEINFKIFGFKPGDRVYLHVSDVDRASTIKPDYSQLALRKLSCHDPDRGPSPL